MTRVDHPVTGQCPYCGHITTHATPARDDERGPVEGDATMCIRCGEFAIFAFSAAGNMRKPTRDEKSDLDDDMNVARLREAFRRMKSAS